MTKITYPIAKNGIFWTIQGEGHLRGFQMAFVRLAGCSVGCPNCDTDYSVGTRMSVEQAVLATQSVVPLGAGCPWVWITGGEPADYDLYPLLRGLKRAGFSTAVATSGSKRVIPPVDWLSVSPHSTDPAKFQQRYGNEIKVVDGLNGIGVDEWCSAFPDADSDFMYRYVQPLSVSEVEDKESLHRCLEFLSENPRWALSRQDHKAWGVK